MPLSRPAPRKLLHMRRVAVRGYLREDGLIDIEARMTDEKTHSFENLDRNGIRAGEALHDMWIRLTIDEHMVVQDCEAAMDSTPYSICPAVAPNLKRLAGLHVGKGFLRAAAQRLAGVEGCTHLRELLQPAATVAFQTLAGLRGHGTGSAVPAQLLNTCHAYAESGPVVARSRASAPPEEA
jgi:hypothetical protein